MAGDQLVRSSAIGGKLQRPRERERKKEDGEWSSDV